MSSLVVLNPEQFATLSKELQNVLISQIPVLFSSLAGLDKLNTDILETLAPIFSVISTEVASVCITAVMDLVTTEIPSIAIPLTITSVINEVPPEIGKVVSNIVINFPLTIIEEDLGKGSISIIEDLSTITSNLEKKLEGLIDDVEKEIQQKLKHSKKVSFGKKSSRS